jgi:predicted NBD/HSP70 family sugar kinase
MARQLENTFNLPVLIDSDTRVIGIAEQVLGEAKGIENVLVVKVSRSLGLSIIFNSQVLFGAKGFAGQNFYCNTIIAAASPDFCSLQKVGMRKNYLICIIWHTCQQEQLLFPK